MSRPDEELPLSPLKPIAEDVHGELADHIARRTDELVGQGWTPADARVEAERVFGDIDDVSADCRAITSRDRRARRRAERLDGLSQDLRFAIRLLRRSPTFAVVAILTLALGVGANTAIFSLINGALLRPLPYDHGEQLADVVELHQKGWAHPSYANFVDLQAQSRSFQTLAGYVSGSSTVLGGDQPMRITTASVTSGFFRVFRLRPELGRLTAPLDHQLGALPVAVVSDRFWRDHLGTNRDLQSIRLRGEFNFRVIGVLPPGFDFPGDVDLWQPLELEHEPVSRTAHGTRVIGRLKPGVTLASAQRDLNVVFQRIGETAGSHDRSSPSAW